MPDSNMSENSKYSLLLLGSVLLLVFVVLYIMQPLREDIQKNEQELTQAQQRLASYQTFAEQNKDYNAFAAKQEGYLAEAKKLLPDIVTVPELVQEYSNLSKECGIQFKSVKPPSGNLKQVNGAYEVPLNISISGNYYKMVEFLQKVENGTRFAKLNKASVNTVKENDASGNLDMTAPLTTAYGVNSVSIIQFIVGLENELNIEFDDSELALGLYYDMNDMIKAVEAKVS